ncbi:MAG: cohesin domain-containing protein [bacterium]
MSITLKIKLGFLALAFSLLSPFYASAATLDLALEQNISSVKDDVVVLVTLNSEGQDVNTAQATISFPANLLSVTKLDQIGSIFSFWLEEPSFDNAKGTIRFVGGATSGFTGSGLKVLRVAFKVKGSGSGRLGITDGAITASDGTGSNVYTTAKGLDISIPATADFTAVKAERSQQEATIAKQLPALIGLDVPFYPDATKWNNHSASFQAKWNVTSDVIQQAISLDNKPTTIPAASPTALIGSRVFSALADGVWYIHIRSQNNIGWSPTLHYRIAIDTAPPVPFKITSDSGFKTGEPSPIIRYVSSDVTSGLDVYSIRIDGVLATTTKLTNYRLSALLPGVHNLVVTAVDKAGNSTSQAEVLEILPIASPTISYVNRKVVLNEGEIVAGGTASVGVEIIVQIQNSEKQIVIEQVVPIDSNGNWNVTINEAMTEGNYYLMATARDRNMSSSFPVVSQSISVKPRPMLVIGVLEITQAWFFIDLIIILLLSFGAGVLTYYNWRGQLGRRVTIAQRDVINILENIRKNIDKLLKDYKGGDLSDSDLTKIEQTLKSMKSDIEKSSHYVVDNIREINR